ncbi:MAG: succinate dehydrogenase, cytochrome b556 subunit [Gammaproteobacteria bacterium]|nr:succinate dehydrogenase, cytochrome b556 subunit [Gammaproteobacteria bacterium]
MVGWRSRNNPNYWAFIVHRLSGLLLTAFLPIHFWVLALAIEGEAALDVFVKWTEQPLVKAAEVSLVILLAAHLTGGLRLLALEFLPWHGRQSTWVVLSGGMSIAAGLLFILFSYY